MQAQCRDLKKSFCIPIPVWIDGATDCTDVSGSALLECRVFISDLIQIIYSSVDANYEEIKSSS